MIGSRILSDNENAVGLLEIFHLHTSFADADAFVQGRTTRFVAHIRTIRQIIGTKLPNEKLVEESRLVTCAPARVKGGSIRTR